MSPTSLALPGLLLAVALASPACSYATYTPPSRTMPLETAHAPDAGRTDLQLEVNRVGSIMGFDTGNGAARLRRGVHQNVAVTAEGGLLHVNGGEGANDPNAYLGRVGFHLHQTKQKHVALTGGVGSGRSSVAGSWVSYDVGVVISTETFHTVPFASLEVFGSTPVNAKRFTFSDLAGDPVTDQLSTTRGVRGTLGFEWRPLPEGPQSKTSVLVGLSYGGLADADGDDEVFGLGAALKFKL